MRSHSQQCDRRERSGCPGTKMKRLLLPKGSHFCSRGSQGITIKMHHLQTHFEYSGIYTDTDRQTDTNTHTPTHAHQHTHTHMHTPSAHLTSSLLCFFILQGCLSATFSLTIRILQSTRLNKGKSQ